MAVRSSIGYLLLLMYRCAKKVCAGRKKIRVQEKLCYNS